MFNFEHHLKRMEQQENSKGSGIVKCQQESGDDAKYREKLMEKLGMSTDAKRIHRISKNPWGDLSYSQLIEYAIETSVNKRLKLNEIYNWFIKYIPYFKEKYFKNITGWKVINKLNIVRN